MARANQLARSGGIFHVTHRCHNRAFLLKFAGDRDAYRAILRAQLPRFKLPPVAKKGAPPSTKVVDIVAMLQESLKQRSGKESETHKKKHKAG